MKLEDSVIVQAVHLASASGQFTETPAGGWINHFVVLATQGHMEVIVSPQDILCGFMTWTRRHKPTPRPMLKLPDDLDRGAYIQIILAVVHPRFGGEMGRNLIREMRDMVLDKCPDAEFWSWTRNRGGKDRFVIRTIRRKDYVEAA